MSNSTQECPKCHSNQTHISKRGFNGIYAAIFFIVLFVLFFIIGGLLIGFIAGLIGILAGTIDSNKIIITCLNCGNKFTPTFQTEKSKLQRKISLIGNIIIGAVVIAIIILIIFLQLGKN